MGPGLDPGPSRALAAGRASERPRRRDEQRGRPAGQVTIRGFSAIADQFIDGIRDDSLYFRDLLNIERIEVLKGPAAVLHGRGSSGGLINRVTKKPQDGSFGEVRLDIGSHALRRASFDVNRTANDAVRMRITGAFEDSGSYREHGFVARRSVAPSLAFRLGPQTKLLLQAEFAKDKRITDFGIPVGRSTSTGAPTTARASRGVTTRRQLKCGRSLQR